MVTHSSRKFEWDKRTRSFSAEISELGPNPFSRIYPDSADEGFQMISARTSAIAEFVKSGEIRSKDADNELKGWVFVPTPKSIQAQPYLRGVTVTILND